MQVADGLLGVALLLVLYVVSDGVGRLLRWHLEFLDRREAALFREQLLVAEAELSRWSCALPRVGEDVQ
jgi:hypothetical protein